MRTVAPVALALATLLLVSALPVEAKPFPQTQNAVRELARETLHDADMTGAEAVRTAARLLREARGVASGLVPLPVMNGELELRGAAAQPVVRGTEESLALGWMAAKDATPWTGAFWIEANGRATRPNVITLDSEGGLILLDGGPLPLPETVDITFHFLGLEGEHTARHAGVSRILDFHPIEEQAHLGLAFASAPDAAVAGIVLTPWNTLGRHATIGVTLHTSHGDGGFIMADCADHTATVTSADCRMVYPVYMPEGFTGLTLWHLDGDERVEDLTLTLDELMTGYASPL